MICPAEGQWPALVSVELRRRRLEESQDAAWFRRPRAKRRFRRCLDGHPTRPCTPVHAGVEHRTVARIDLACAKALERGTPQHHRISAISRGSAPDCGAGAGGAASERPCILVSHVGGFHMKRVATTGRSK